MVNDSRPTIRPRKRLQIQMELPDPRDPRPRWSGLQSVMRDDVVGLVARLLLASAVAERERDDG